MQFMLIVKGGCETSQSPQDELVAAVMSYTQELRKAGVLVELSRLHPSSQGARVKFLRTDRMVVDGPFAETKEVVGGYWIIETNSLNEAIEWAKRAPAPEDVPWEIEIRQFRELEHFFPAMQLDAGTEVGGVLAKSQKQSL
jgi:hypothetical protein